MCSRVEVCTYVFPVLSEGCTAGGGSVSGPFLSRLAPPRDGDSVTARIGGAGPAAPRHSWPQGDPQLAVEPRESRSQRQSGGQGRSGGRLQASAVAEWRKKGSGEGGWDRGPGCTPSWRPWSLWPACEGAAPLQGIPSLTGRMPAPQHQPSKVSTPPWRAWGGGPREAPAVPPLEMLSPLSHRAWPQAWEAPVMQA